MTREDVCDQILELGEIVGIGGGSAPLAIDFCSEPRWSMAAAAMTPRVFDTAFSPASFPGVKVIRRLLAFDIYRRDFTAQGL